MPHKATLTNALVDLLCIEREAVYRRMRGDVAFSFAEIADKLFVNQVFTHNNNFNDCQ